MMTAFFSGGLLASVLAWFLLRVRHRQDLLKLESELTNTRSILEEKLQNKNEKIIDLETLVTENREHQNSLASENTSLKSQLAELNANLKNEIKNSTEKLKLLEDAKTELTNAFQALSSDALSKNNKTFLDLAKENLEKFQNKAKADLKGREDAISELVKPLKESLGKVDQKIAEIEKERGAAYASLTEQVKSLSATQGKLQNETQNLVKALRAPQVRGRWGEMTLKRVAELSGMVEHCDFSEQISQTTETGRLRPDMIVRLPGGKQIVVDAKTPLQAYLNALETQVESEQEAHLKDHTRQVQDHLRQLGQKSYWDQFKPTPEFVVMFVPGESFFSAALKHNPALIEQGVEQGVILATPTTLISLLKSVGYGWRQEKLAQNAEEISELGKQMYERIATLVGHLEKLGDSLKNSVEHYNKTIGAIESRVLPATRKFEELGVKSKDRIERVSMVEKTPRLLAISDIPAE